jgi:alpha-beta hydrolase superfamily lysophospholipase
MKRVLRWIVAFAMAVTAMSFIFPRDSVDRVISFDAKALPDDLDAYLAAEEAKFTDITPGSAKRIVWAGAVGAKTPLAIIYIHGFSATAEEIRPVPDMVAQAVGANLFYTRLAGHGRTGAALGEVTAGDWVEDLAQAMAIGHRLGERVVIISTSTGAPLAMIAATDPALMDGLAGVVMISPNLGVKAAAGMILDMPLARYWGPMVAGVAREFPPKNEGQAAHWTTRYPTVALFPMQALVREGRNLDLSTAKAPALFIFAEKDQVIDPARIPALVEAWGGTTQVEKVVMGPGDDVYSHVLAGDILSPGQTANVAGMIINWVTDVVH